jgi:hypothetical protein
MHNLSKLARRTAPRRVDLVTGDCRRKGQERGAAGAVATVNGVAILADRRQCICRRADRHRALPDSPELKKAVREELIRRELLVQEAKKLGLDKKPDVAAQADLARQAIYIRAFVQDYVKKNPISDEQAKAAYERMKSPRWAARSTRCATSSWKRKTTPRRSSST